MKINPPKISDAANIVLRVKSIGLKTLLEKNKSFGDLSFNYDTMKRKANMLSPKQAEESKR